MKLSPALIWLAFLCLAAPVAAQQTTNGGEVAEVVTLSQAVDEAMDNNPLLKAASLEVDKAGENIAATRTQRLPHTSVSVLGSQLLNQLKFTVPAGQFGTYPGIGPIPDVDTPITTPRRFNAYVVGQVAQPLSQLYKLQLGIQQGEFARLVSKQKLREQRQSVADGVKKLYFAALEKESALEASEQTVRFYREMDRLVTNYVAQRVALTSDSLDVKAKLAKEEYELLTLHDALANTREQLAQLMGRDIRNEFHVSPLDEPTPPEMDIVAARNRALDQRPDLERQRLQVKQAEQDRKIKKAEYIPDVSLTFNYVSPFGIEFVPKNIASAGVQLTWEPFDWGRKKHELNEKSRTVDQARNTMTDAEQKVIVEVNDKYRKLAEARALIRVTQLARDASVEKSRLAQTRYAEQTILLRDAMQAEADAAEASYNYRKAILRFWTARTEFEKALGEDQ